MGPEFGERVDRAVESIRNRSEFTADLALITGTGLGGLVDHVEVDVAIGYHEIQGFPVSTAPSHRGELVLGRLHGRSVAALNGRFHLYEGWQAEDIVLPVYVLKALGARHLVVTNAAGALNPDLAVADAMLIEDHISFQSVHPLAGPNDGALGPRFPDMSRAYDPDLRSAALETADRLNVVLKTGVYAAVHGPQFETSAERRFFRMAGCDAVGMSTALEVTAASHCGLATLGFSAITNSAAGGPDQRPDTLEEILENADKAARTMQKIILTMIADGKL